MVCWTWGVVKKRVWSLGKAVFNLVQSSIKLNSLLTVFQLYSLYVTSVVFAWVFVVI